MTLRTVRTFFTRFMAILMIVALSAGFFAGLKVTTSAMLHTGERYLDDQNFYDFRLLSTYGFTKEDVLAFSNCKGISEAEGSYSIDALLSFDGKVSPYKIFSLTDKTNRISLEGGRMPSAAHECLADIDRYTEKDIGKTFTLTAENEDAAKGMLNEQTFTIVGLCNSPLYLGIDRGTAAIGSGTVSTFLYLPKEAFSSPSYTEVNLTLHEKAEIYSDEYDALTEQYRGEIRALAETSANEKYSNFLSQHSLTPEAAASLGMEAPVVYLLTRAENPGYASFENDTGIISGVANIFPIFFIAIAILVCSTTMSRMVNEERTQIGALKSLGFGKGAIMAKYLLYATIATLVGWTLGFFLCTWALPKIFWLAYNEIYNFAPIRYLFSPSLAIITLSICLASILLTTYLCCRRELAEVPAALIRPKAGKAGKRVLMERIKPIWSRLNFLHKITVRNMFLYKRRMIMMLVGIACCAGLLVTAFGVRDSMIDIGHIQYEDIQTYALEISHEEQDSLAVKESVQSLAEVTDCLPVRCDFVQLSAENSMSSVHLMSFCDEHAIQTYWNLTKDGKALRLPAKGEVLISPKIAEKLSLSAGDRFEIQMPDLKSATVTVADVFDNHIYDYVLMSSSTYESLFGEHLENTLLVHTDADPEALAKAITEFDTVTTVTQLQTMENNISQALNCLNYIIWLIVFFSGALAFIVTFNLTNINIAERRREIATVQVLGFYPRETERYVLNENLVLSVIAAILGLPLGKVFHKAVMSMVKIDLVTFGDKIEPQSYLFSFLLTVLFALLVNRAMKRQINKVNMTESLKSVE